MYKKISFILMAVMVVVMIFTIKSCYTYKAKSEDNNKNIIALKDSLRSYVTSKGDTVFTTSAYNVNDYTELKTLCNDMYSELSTLKRNNLTSGVVFSGNVQSNPSDTMWVIQNDTVKHIIKDFDFKDQYRELSGNVFLNKDTLGLNIKKDMFNLDYTVAVDSKSQVYVKSNNPYVKMNCVKGFTITKEKVKRFGVGANISYGFDFANRKFAPSIGIGVQYNFIRF